MKLLAKIAAWFFGLLGVAIVALALTVSYTRDCEDVPRVQAGDVSMKAVVHHCYGSPDVLSYEDVDIPVPEPDEVLVRVYAAAVNPLDRHYLRGSPYLMRLGSGIGAPKDIRLGVDFAGVVEAVGRNVRDYIPGDRVFGGSSGAFAEFVTARAGGIAMIPDNVTFEQAAALPIAAITALQALRDHGELQPGDKVLINGASGGVGTYAVQIARSMGAEVHGVCSTRNVAMVTALGADRVFDYTRENYIESGESFDLIVDMVGNHSVSANRKALEPDGRLVLVGGPKSNWLAPFMRPLEAMLISPFVDQQLGMMIATLEGDDLAILAGLLASGEVESMIDRRYALAEVDEAIRYSEQGRARGKIIITVP